MLIQITILAIIFLDEVLTGWKLLGIIYVFFGVLIVQLTPKDSPILSKFILQIEKYMK